MSIEKFEFNKNIKGEWYLNLPEWKGDPEELQMVEGADRWLSLLAGHAVKINVLLSDKKFAGADNLTLLHIRDANLGGGGNYYLETYKGKEIGLKLWLCEVTRFVFGTIPQRIYFKLSEP